MVARALALVALAGGLATATGACHFDAAGAGDEGGDSGGDGGPIGPGDASPPDAAPVPAQLLLASKTGLVELHRLPPGASAWELAAGTNVGEELAPRWLAMDHSPAGLALAYAAGATLVVRDGVNGPATSFDGMTPAIDRVRAFDVAVEGRSGDVLVVWSDGTSRARVARRSGADWSEGEALPVNDGVGPTLNLGTVEWVELVAEPGSDRVILIYSDDLRRLAAILWDGEAWRVSASIVLTDMLKRNEVRLAVDNRAFDAAFEATTGDALVVWGDDAHTGVGFAQHDFSSDVWDLPASELGAPANGEVHQVDLAARPGSDEIALAACDLGDGVERLGVGTWGGTSWETALELDMQARNWEDQAQGRAPCAVIWKGDEAVVVYADEQGGQLHGARYGSGLGWALEPPLPVPNLGKTDSVLLFEAGGGDIGVALVDESGKLFSARRGTGGWQLLVPSTLSEELIVDALPLAVIDARP